MAKPRVFISSTFYDLKQIREDLERAIKELGYEPVRNETGNVAYGKDEPLESYCYKELELCDIIVSIVGGRYGSESKQKEGHSISQVELKTALDRGIPVFIFVERSVFAEYETFKINKGNDSVKYRFVDNTKVYEFLDSVVKLPQNNPISTFEVSAEITEYLRIQWAGLFQRFLQDQKRQAEMKVLDEMRAVAGTLQKLVTFLTEERKDKDDAIKNILAMNHPAFRRLAECAQFGFRIFFTNVEEMTKLLSSHGWYVMPENEWDDPQKEKWVSSETEFYIAIDRFIFNNDGSLRLFTDADWSDNYINAKQPTVQTVTSRSSNYSTGYSTQRPGNPSAGRSRASQPPNTRRPSPPSSTESEDDIPF